MSESRKRYQGSVPPKDHIFSGKIICPYCGSRYTRKTTNGKAAWVCGRYLRFGKDTCPSKRIPENILFDLASDMDISEIRCDGEDGLDFHLKSGRVVHKKWQNRSRKESWTDHMKEEARRRAVSCMNPKR